MDCVRSGVVCGSCKSVLVEGLSIADVTTKITEKATTHDNDDDDGRMTTIQHDEPRSTPAMWTPRSPWAHPQTRPNSLSRAQLLSSRPVPLDCGAVTGGIHTGRTATSPALAGSSREPLTAKLGGNDHAANPSDISTSSSNQDPGRRKDRDLARTRGRTPRCLCKKARRMQKAAAKVKLAEVEAEKTESAKIMKPAEDFVELCLPCEDRA